MEAMLGCCNPCNSAAHAVGATRIVLGPYLALFAAKAELRALRGEQGAGEEEQAPAWSAPEGAPGDGAPGDVAAGAGGARRGSHKRVATQFLAHSGSKRHR